jgi:hypothetical protein
MSQLSNATLTTLENVYYDDYNEDKGYYRILFRPSTAVQARELNQLQTILQQQVSRHGDHIFKDGSVVSGCIATQFGGIPYVRVVDAIANNVAGFNTVEDIDSTYLITNSTNTVTAVRASVYYAKKGYAANYPDTNRLYVNYIYTGKDGSNNNVAGFSNSDTLYVYSSNQGKLATLSNTNLVAQLSVITTNSTATDATGQGFLVTATDGVVYQKGFFQKAARQTVVVNDFYPNANSVLIGYETTESIINENQDLTLNDNANGSTNYNAPGAHRLRLTPNLVVKSKTDVANNKNFFSILEFDGNTAVQVKTDPQYAAINDVMAKRTYEESGDYVISPFNVITTSNAQYANVFNYEISTGVAYVKGNRVEYVGTKRIQSTRANTTNIVQNKNITANYGQFVYCQSVVGAMNFDSLGEVAIYDAAFQAITDREGVSGGTSGNIVGYANVKTVKYYSGTKGHADCQYYVYLFNIRMNKGKNFSNDAKTLYASSGTYGAFKADIVLTNGLAVLQDTTLTPLVYDSGFKAIKSLTPTGGNLDVTLYYRKTSSGTYNSSGVFTFSLSGGLGTGGTDQLYSTDATQYQMVLATNSYSSNLTGNVTVTSGCTAITGTGTFFQTQLIPGDIIRISNSVNGTVMTGIVNAITSNTIATLTATASASATGNNYQRYFPDGTIYPVTGSMLAINAAANSITITTDMTFGSGGNTAYIQYPVARTPAKQIAKTVVKRNLIKIDCSNNVANSVGPWYLGVPDVLKINAVYVGTASSYANTGVNYSSWFKLDNGQGDDVYDIASIAVLPAYKGNITSSSTLLVDFDYFTVSTSGGIGYASIDSYPISSDGITSNSTTITIADIPIYNSDTSGTTYDLRNSIDFRPYKANTVALISTTDPANTSIPINPGSANTNTYNVSSYGQYLPEVDSQFITDFEYYVPRYEMILVSGSGEATTLSGMAEVYPKKPINTTDSAIIAEAYVPPFPSLTMSEAAAVNRKDMATVITLKSNKRYTMRDISVLDDRISKLEYYTVLNFLEKQAKDTAVPSATGQDRFKNGIFADPFNDTSLADNSNIEQLSSIDPVGSLLRSDFADHQVDLKYNGGGSGTTQVGSNIMLSYGSEIFAQQKYATKYRVCTESIWRWVGQVILSPSQDIFSDSGVAPAINITQDLTASVSDLNGLKIFGSQSSVVKQDKSAPITQTVAGSQITGAVTGTVGGGTSSSVTTTTSVTTSTGVAELSVGSSQSTYNLGTYATDINLVKYMRSTTIAFYAKNLRPNAKLHVFFDGKNVDQYVAPGSTSYTKVSDFNYASKQSSIVTASGPMGITASNPLVADSSGNVAGLFTIPANTFTVGEKRLLITNVDNLVTGSDAILCRAEGTFNSSGVAVTRQSATLTTINPEITHRNYTDTNVISFTSTDTSFSPDAPTPIVIPPPTVIDNSYYVPNPIDVPVPTPVNVYVPVPTTVDHYVPNPIPVPTPVIVQVEVDRGGGGGDAGAGSCFVLNSVVTMADGSHKFIQDVVLGDKLKGETGINTVIQMDYDTIGGSNIKRTPHVYGFNGKGRFVTCEHPIKTTDGWKSLDPEATEKRYPQIKYLNITKLEIGDTIVYEDKVEVIESIETYEDQDAKEIVYNFVLDGDHTYYVNGILVHNKDPIAQTFKIVTPTTVNGQFISQVGLFFKSKDATKGCTVFLVEMTGGFPDMSKILGKGHLESSEITVSDDSSAETIFVLDYPVYVQNGLGYSFVIQPDSSSPDYEIFTCEIGNFDLLTNIQVYNNPYDGDMFLSSDNMTWTDFRTEDIKFNLYRCRFNAYGGTTQFVTGDDEYLTISNVAKANTRDIQVGDVVYTANTSKIANTTTGAPVGIVSMYDSVNGKMYLDTTTAGFAAGQTIQFHRIMPQITNTSVTSGNTGTSNNLTSTIIAYANVTSVDNLKYHVITPKFATMIPQQTSMNFTLNGTDGSYTYDTNAILIKNEVVNEPLDKERILVSRSNEAINTSNNKSTVITAILSTTNPYVSPVIDMRRKGVFFTENLINNDVTNENTTHGNALSKYISKKVILADGQDAEDLLVYITAFRPQNSDIKIYAKFQSADDPESFDSKDWTLLSYKNGSDLVYSSNKNLSDVYEFDFGVPTGTNTTVTFNSCTAVNSTSEFISITNNPFTNNQLLYYYADASNTVVSGLANTTFYYAVQANSTGLCLSTAQNGSNINITSTGTTASVGHYLRGYNTATPHSAFLNADNSGILEYFNNSNSRSTSFKYFQIKIVMTSTDRVNIPRINDIRAIALQK